MRLRAHTLATLAGLALAGPSYASNGLVDLSWNQCSPVVSDLTTNTPGLYSLFVSVTGFDQPHQAYESTLLYGDANGAVPDAWRFDPVGCEGTPFVRIDHIAPSSVAKVCPSFQGAASTAQVKAVDFVPPSDTGSGYLLTQMRCTLFNVYPNDGAGSPNFNPAVRYFLMRVEFDLTYAVTGATTPNASCGGWEQPMCFQLGRAGYLDLAGTEVPFGRSTPFGQAPIVTFNGGGVNCGTSPARPATWGSIKNQYRR